MVVLSRYGLCQRAVGWFRCYGVGTRRSVWSLEFHWQKVRISSCTNLNTLTFIKCISLLHILVRTRGTAILTATSTTWGSGTIPELPPKSTFSVTYECNALVDKTRKQSTDNECIALHGFNSHLKTFGSIQSAVTSQAHFWIIFIQVVGDYCWISKTCTTQNTCSRFPTHTNVATLPSLHRFLCSAVSPD